MTAPKRLPQRVTRTPAHNAAAHPSPFAVRRTHGLAQGPYSFKHHRIHHTPMTYADSPHLPDPLRAPQFYEGVALKRFIAWVIDSALIFVLSLLIVPFTAFTALFFLPLLYLVVGFGYRAITIGSASATFGMRIMSIELRDSRGERFDFSQALVHTLGFTLSMAFFLVQAVSIILMIGSARGQSLTDMALGTVMINRR